MSTDTVDSTEEIPMSTDTVDSTEESLAAVIAAMTYANVKKVFDQLVEQTQTQLAERSRNAEREVQQNDDLYNRIARQNDAWFDIATQQARANAMFATQMQQTNAAALARAQINAATVDHLAATNATVFSGVLGGDTLASLKAAKIAETSMMSDLADQFQTVAQDGIKAAVVAATAANPVVMGSSGTTQASFQTAQAAGANAATVAVASLVDQLAAVTNAMMVADASLAAQISRMSDTMASQMAAISAALAVLNTKVTADAVVAK